MHFGMLIDTTDSHLSLLPFGIWGNAVSFSTGPIVLHMHVYAVLRVSLLNCQPQSTCD